MNDEDKEKQPIGVSSFLPAMAAAVLVRAADRARCYEQSDLERVRVIDNAIREVHDRWPDYFTTAGRASTR